METLELHLLINPNITAITVVSFDDELPRHLLSISHNGDGIPVFVNDTKLSIGGRVIRYQEIIGSTMSTGDHTCFVCDPTDAAWAIDALNRNEWRTYDGDPTIAEKFRTNQPLINRSIYSS